MTEPPAASTREHPSASGGPPQGDVGPRHRTGSAEIIETNLPSRLDRLPWGRFHTLIIFALGVTWLLDGLEVTLAGAVASALKSSPTLHFSNADVGLTGSAYIAGAVLGALRFGWLTDPPRPPQLFFITPPPSPSPTAATPPSLELA